MGTRRTALSRGAPSKVRVCEQMRGDAALVISYPTYLPVMEGGVYVTHKPVQVTVALPRPFSYAAGKSANGAQQVIAGHPRAIEDLHEDPGGKRLKDAVLFELIFRL